MEGCGAVVDGDQRLDCLAARAVRRCRMRFVIVLVILAVAVAVLYRVNNRRAAAEAARTTEQYADRGWTAAAVGDRVERTDLRVEGSSHRGHRFVATSYPSASDTQHVEATVAFADLFAVVALPAVRRHKGKVTIRGRGDSDRAVLETVFGGEELSHLDHVRGATLRSLKVGEGPVEFHTSRMATSRENLAATIECLDQVAAALAAAGYVQPAAAQTEAEQRHDT